MLTLQSGKVFTVRRKHEKATAVAVHTRVIENYEGSKEIKVRMPNKMGDPSL